MRALCHYHKCKTLDKKIHLRRWGGGGGWGVGVGRGAFRPCISTVLQSLSKQELRQRVYSARQCHHENMPI